MTEKEQLSPREVWETLTGPEQEVCIYLGVSHWQSGNNQDYMDAMGLNQKDIDELVKRGIVDARPGWEFAQEYLDENREEIKKLDEKLGDPLTRLTDEERGFSSMVRNRKNILEVKNKEIRYRLADEKLHDFVEDLANAK